MKILETIELKPIELHKQKPIQVLACRLILYNNAIEYILNFWANETETDDEELMKDPAQWEEVYNNFHIIVDKRNISGIEKSYRYKSDVYLVSIYVKGFDGPILIYFDTDEKAKFLINRLTKYLFK
jgi:hypothetical protein